MKRTRADWARRLAVAAARLIPTGVVEEVLNALDARRVAGQISDVTVEINERAKP